VTQKPTVVGSKKQGCGVFGGPINWSQILFDMWMTKK